jgi:hypothetical protein
MTQLIIRLTNTTKNIKKVQYPRQRIYKLRSDLSGICSHIRMSTTREDKEII